MFVDACNAWKYVDCWASPTVLRDLEAVVAVFHSAVVFWIDWIG